MVSEKVDPQRLVFVDEMGANTSLHPLYAWSRRGERAYCSTPRNRGKNTTLLASMSAEGMGPSFAVTGSVSRGVRGLSGAGSPTAPLPGTARGDGQPLRPQEREG
jgi:hypothetical protein